MRQVLNESFFPKSLTCARSAGISARSHDARTFVMRMDGPSSGAGDGPFERLRRFLPRLTPETADLSRERLQLLKVRRLGVVRDHPEPVRALHVRGNG